MRVFLLILLLPLTLLGQNNNPNRYLFISTQVDARNAVFGSDVNEPAYDGIFSLGFRDHEFTIQANYETFEAIHFKSYGFSGGYILNHERPFKYIISGGISMIERRVNWINQVWHPSLQGSLSIEYHLDRFFIVARSELRLRGDINKVKPSGYLLIGIKL